MALARAEGRGWADIAREFGTTENAVRKTVGRWETGSQAIRNATRTAQSEERRKVLLAVQRERSRLREEEWGAKRLAKQLAKEAKVAARVATREAALAEWRESVAQRQAKRELKHLDFVPFEKLTEAVVKPGIDKHLLPLMCSTEAHLRLVASIAGGTSCSPQRKRALRTRRTL